jgi:hypothetical protein
MHYEPRDQEPTVSLHRLCLPAENAERPADAEASQTASRAWGHGEALGQEAPEKPKGCTGGPMSGRSRGGRQPKRGRMMPDWR